MRSQLVRGHGVLPVQDHAAEALACSPQELPSVPTLAAGPMASVTLSYHALILEPDIASLKVGVRSTAYGRRRSGRVWGLQLKCQLPS